MGKWTGCKEFEDRYLVKRNGGRQMICRELAADTCRVFSEFSKFKK